MKKDLDHLPLRKQDELRIVVDVLFEEFETWSQNIKPRGGKATGGRIVKIILFGSFARGGWVEDRLTGYRSDFDILVVVNKDYLVEASEIWSKAEDRFFREKRVKTPVQIIVHTLGEVNDFLGRGQYFFSDIVKEGIELYHLPGHRFREPQPLTPEVAYDVAKEHYEEWIEAADDFFDIFNYAFSKKSYKRGAFLLHQATESLYVCFLLVITNYRPNTHNLKHLRSLTESREERLRDIWPGDTKPARRRFDLLKRAYVEARYSKHYKITEEELIWLVERVKALRVTVEAACKERLSALEAVIQQTPHPNPLPQGEREHD